MTRTPVSPRWSSPLQTADGTTLSPEPGKEVCRWIEGVYRLGEGDWHGQDMVLRPFQRRFITRLNERFPDGRRRYREAYLLVAKGNGKTPTAGAVGVAELLGPYRTISPRITMGAASLENADIVFTDASTGVVGLDGNPSPARPLVEVFQREIQLKGHPTAKIERIAAADSTNDGGRTSCFIADELHEWLTPKQRGVFTKINGAVTKRADGFVFGISTAGVRGAGAKLEEIYEYGVKVARGEIVDDGLLFECYEAPDGVDLDDEEQFWAAVGAANPTLGDLVDPDLIRRRFDRLPRFEFERYHLNHWTAAQELWIDLETWDANAGTPTISKQDAVYAAVAGRSWRDQAAIVVVRKDEGGKHHAHMELLEPTGGNRTVDPDAIKAQARRLYATYDLQQFLVPQLFTQVGLELEEEGLPVVAVPPGPKKATAYTQALFDVVIEHRLRHGGDPVLRQHAQGAVARVKDDGFLLEPLKATVPIVGVTALAMAVEAAEADEGGDAGGIVVINL